MKNEKRTVKYDPLLQIEVYRFEGVMQEFPNHFHEHYTIGLIETGCRLMICEDTEYQTGGGDLIILPPGKRHSCKDLAEIPLDYRCMNVMPEVIMAAAADITGHKELPNLSGPVVKDFETAAIFRELHEMMMEGQKEFLKEELFYFLLRRLLCQEKGIAKSETKRFSAEMALVCRFMKANYSTTISLDQLSELAGMNKYTFLRSFTKQQGITPYQYLMTVRINEAKRLLIKGTEPVAAAMLTGFSDQSHFTRFFKSLLGLTPGQYQDIFKENVDNRAVY